MRNVDTNCSSPKISATLTWPTTLVGMKSRAHAERITYSAYQRRNAAVIGKTNLRRDLRRLSNSGLCATATYRSLAGAIVESVTATGADVSSTTAVSGAAAGSGGAACAWTAEAVASSSDVSAGGVAGSSVPGGTGVSVLIRDHHLTGNGGYSRTVGIPHPVVKDRPGAGRGAALNGVIHAPGDARHAVHRVLPEGAIST